MSDVEGSVVSTLGALQCSPYAVEVVPTHPGVRLGEYSARLGVAVPRWLKRRVAEAKPLVGAFDSGGCRVPAWV